MDHVPQLPGHEVQFVPGYRAEKRYTCPECHHGIHVGVGHIVAWEADQVDDRRHWHLNCWRVRVRRGRLA